MTLRDQLAAIEDPTERARLKGRAFSALSSLAGQSWSRGKLTATIIDGPHVDASERMVSLSVRVTRDGRDITPPDLNPISYVNPPILVPDAAGDVDRDGQRFREDLRAALLTIVRDTLRLKIGL